MGVILHFPYSYLYIYSLLTCIYKPVDSLTVNLKVSINQNITGLIGNNDTSLTCVCIKEANKQLIGIEVFAINKTEDLNDEKPIAIFKPNQPAILHLYGQYLTGRVTLTNITSTSTNATLTFKELKCDDERDYLCKCNYEDIYGFSSSEKSQPTRISVHVMSSKPDHISSIIVTSTTGMQGSTSSIYSIPSSIETVTNTQSLSTDNLPLVYNEEDNVLFTCTGNIGNPPGKLIWQKTFPQGKTPITYTNETTYIEEIPGKCSFKGTSHLMVKIYVEDIKATIRCFEESQANETDMYLETEPFDVLLDDLESSQESDWWNFVKEHKIPLICGVAGFIVLCAVIVGCICQKKTNTTTTTSETESALPEHLRSPQGKKARCSKTTKSVDITLSTEYATVIRKNNATLGETGDSMLVLSDMDINKEDKSSNKQEDLGKTVDVPTSYHINEYAVPSDALHTGTINCQIGPGFTSFKDVKDI